MTASEERRNEDLRRLRAMETQSAGRIRILKVHGSPMRRVDLLLAVPTAADQTFPQSRAPEVLLYVDLPTDYPYKAPVCVITSTVFNVNIFSTGTVCLGSKWMPSHQLTLTVARLWRILSLDPEVINPNSPANSNAIPWWQNLLKNHRHLIPTAPRLATEEAPKPKLGWKPIR